jgi:hypothetical protein
MITLEKSPLTETKTDAGKALNVLPELQPTPEQQDVKPDVTKAPEVINLETEQKVETTKAP